MIEKIKSKVRSKFLEKRNEIINIDTVSRTICEVILDYIIKNDYTNIALYYEINKEVSTEYLDQSIEETFYPKIKDNEIYFIRYDRNDLRGMPTSKWGIPEPIGQPVMLKDLDCIVVPGVAFDCDCNRLGYGGGFYDRALQNYSGHIIGVAYDFQVADCIPHMSYDIPVDILFTEKRVIK